MQDPIGTDHSVHSKMRVYMTSFLQHLIDTGWTVQSVPIENGWLEIDSVSDVTLYESMHRDRRLHAFLDLTETAPDD